MEIIRFDSLFVSAICWKVDIYVGGHALNRVDV